MITSTPPQIGIFEPAGGAAMQQQPGDCALLRWDDEGGSARPTDPPAKAIAALGSEIARLDARVIALEKRVVALLARASFMQRQEMHDMAPYAAPREGFTPQLLSTEAAVRMRYLIERGDYFSSHANVVVPGESDTS